MAPHTDRLDTALLLIEILKRIPRQRRVSAAELQSQLAAQGYERDIRTIQRHLDTLSSAFALDRDERSKPFGYRWPEGAPALSLPGLSAPEALLLQLAHEHLRLLLPPRVLQAMAPFFEQAGRTLHNTPHAERERQWPRKVRVVPSRQPLLPPKIAPEVLEQVTTALQDNCWLQLRYRNASQHEREVCVMPLGLVQQSTSLYLVCRFEGYDNERNLALHRMQQAQATRRGFTYPVDFDLARYEADGRFGFGNGQHIQLRFCIDKGAGLHLTESRLSEDQTVQEHEDHYEICATVVDTAMLDWWLLGFGEAVWDVVREPVAGEPPDVQAC